MQAKEYCEVKIASDTGQRGKGGRKGVVVMNGAGAKLIKGATFNPKLLEVLVCPLSKQPLRYCDKSEELFSDSIGVAYPILDGIPCLTPTYGRLLESEKDVDNPPPKT